MWGVQNAKNVAVLVIILVFEQRDILKSNDRKMFPSILIPRDVSRNSIIIIFREKKNL